MMSETDRRPRHLRPYAAATGNDISSTPRWCSSISDSKEMEKGELWSALTLLVLLLWRKW